ncbi:phosphoribosylamine--glycine ligase [Legionella sp. km772]|nr:phosphoribosylamine--glycine ligase [Legionella sp. km772]
MNVLIIGSNAREHALARALARSARKPTLFSCGSTYNPGIAVLTKAYKLINLKDSQAILAQAKAWRIELVIIGPEAPLAYGLVDCLAQRGIACIGPTQALAQIETSKIFARGLMQGLACSPEHQAFHNLTGVKEFLVHLGAGNYVIKPDGLTGGKGVKVAGEDLHSLSEAYDYCVQLLEEKHSFLIEEKLYGQEFSLHCFSDGLNCIAMPAVKDFKRAYPGDRGPNTGSMGCFSEPHHRLSFLTAEFIQQAQDINQTALEALQTKYQKAYKGILYGSFMATKEGVKLIEFNARFGDPEAINLLALLETDFLSLCEDLWDGALGRTPISFAPLASVSKYAVPQGYPENPQTNQYFDYSKLKNKDRLYFASLHYQNKQCFTTASRSVAVLGLGQSLAEAEQEAEAEIRRVTGPLFHREDIGLDFSYASI